MLREMKPHKHAELIKAWADGAAIQTWVESAGRWEDNINPMWLEEVEYRIKPEPKPDIVRYLSFVHPSGDHCFIRSDKDMNSDIKVIFDSETKRLKSVEVVK